MIFKTDWNKHLHKIRKIEINKAFEFFGERKFESGLEVGCGDGYQTSLIYNKFNEFYSVDLNFDRIKIKIPQVNYMKIDGDNFKNIFDNNKFDIVFSSSFLEHLSNSKSFLIESRKYLKKDGYAIHIVPNRFMKIMYLLLFYPNLLIIIIDKIIKIIRGQKIFNNYKGESENNINIKNINFTKKSKFNKIFLPSIHGIYRTHLEEFNKWGLKEWDKLFKNSGYIIVKKIKTSAHSGYGFGFDSLRSLLEKMGFSSLTIYILKKYE